MALPKQARVLSSRKWNDATCHLVCEAVTPEEFHFIGGQYVIVNSGVQLPNGKMGKRAYSVASADSHTKGFELTVRKIPNGPGSTFIHSILPGQIFEFSGPWGKFLPPGEDEVDRIRKVLVIATDTGITAALGLTRGKAFSMFLRKTSLLWFAESREYFIPPEVVKQWLPEGLESWQFVEAPRVHVEERGSFCLREVQERVRQNGYDRVYISGDGYVIAELQEYLLEQGYPEDWIVTESFFNQIQKKAPIAQGL